MDGATCPFEVFDDGVGVLVERVAFVIGLKSLKFTNRLIFTAVRYWLNGRAIRGGESVFSIVVPSRGWVAGVENNASRVA
jgi:hypothetical protein